MGLWLLLQTVMEKVKDTIISGLIANYMKGEGIGLFTTVSVGDLLWGYEDKLLEAAKAFDPTLDSVFGLFYKVGTLLVLADKMLFCKETFGVFMTHSQLRRLTTPLSWSL